jgi:hypothetical protein
MSSRARPAIAALHLVMGLSGSACSSDHASPPAPPPAPVPASTGIPGVPWVTVTTVAPGTSLAPATKTDATWAAYRKEDGSWAKLDRDPSRPATYAFQTRAERWAVVFACADADSSLVAMHEDSIANQLAEVVLDRWCASPSAEAFTLSGTLSNLAADTGWLDFGYALEDRGAVLPSAGASASYEEVNVAAGTWDMAFGVRRDSFTPFSKIAFVRAHALTADATLDVDLASTEAVTPGSEILRIHGYEPHGETLATPVYYTTSGGTRGLDLGPQDIPDVGELDLVYATVPAAAQAPTDRYRAEVTATSNEGSTTRRFIAEFHDAMPLDLSLAAPLSPPQVSVVAVSPYQRIEASLAPRHGAASYEMLATAQVSNRSMRAWRADLPAGLVTSEGVVLTLPDVSSVPGFSPAWGLPTDIERVVTVTVREAPVAMGDGSQTHVVASSTYLEP